jgi:hypothetical protein
MNKLATLMASALIFMATPAHADKGLELQLSGTSHILTGPVETIHLRLHSATGAALTLEGHADSPANERGKGIRCVVTIEGEIGNATSLYDLVVRARDTPGTRLYCSVGGAFSVIQGGTTYNGHVRLDTKDKDSQGFFAIQTGPR